MSMNSSNPNLKAMIEPMKVSQDRWDEIFGKKECKHNIVETTEDGVRYRECLKCNFKEKVEDDGPNNTEE